ncbi:MAG: hypothetical protein LH650_16495, partial [Chloroflexi bacterium]|nr:hypothetical protein [Chloroflexota bacterium]
MPPRNTDDFDLMVRLTDLDRAGRAAQAAGRRLLRTRTLYENLEGTAWEDEDKRLLDLIGVPGLLGDEAVSTAQANTRGGLPTLTLPYLVTLKLISARMTDSGDIGRMLGLAAPEEVEQVRA